MQGAQPALVSDAERSEIFHAIDGYGDGWMVDENAGQLRYRHTGEAPGS